MTWEEWVNSSYNTVGAMIGVNYISIECSSDCGGQLKCGNHVESGGTVVPGVIYIIHQ